MKDPRDVVKQMNDKLFDKCKVKEVEGDYFSYLEYIETPIGAYVKWTGQYLWDSENDCREWVSDDEQEDLEGFLVKEMGKVSEAIFAQLKVLSPKHKAIASIYDNRPSKEEIRESLMKPFEGQEK